MENSSKILAEKVLPYEDVPWFINALLLSAGPTASGVCTTHNKTGMLKAYFSVTLSTIQYHVCKCMLLVICSLQGPPYPMYKCTCIYMYCSMNL